MLLFTDTETNMAWKYPLNTRGGEVFKGYCSLVNAGRQQVEDKTPIECADDDRGIFL